MPYSFEQDKDNRKDSVEHDKDTSFEKINAIARLVQPANSTDFSPTFDTDKPFSIDAIAQVVLKGHPETWNGRFYFKFAQRLIETFIRKNTDYAGTAQPDALANFKKSNELGISTLKGILVRCTDKWSRINTLVSENRPGEVKDESLEDTLLDMANYLIIAAMAIEDAKRDSK
jgi:hypothetical protein